MVLNVCLDEGMRLLSGITVLSVLVVAGIVLFGSTQEATHLFGTSTTQVKSKNNPPSIKVGRNPLVQSRANGFAQSAHNLLQGVHMDSISAAGVMSNQEVIASFRSAEPQTKVYKRVAIGRLIYRRLNQNTVALCWGVQKTDWTCQAGYLNSGINETATGVTLARSLQAAKLALSQNH